MFKKIEIWVLYLVILCSLLFAVGFGVLVRQELVGSVKAGWASKAALALSEIPVNIKMLMTKPGLRVEDRFPDKDGFDGAPNSEQLYLLLSRFDGDLEQGVVELVDLKKFEVLHTWNPDIDAFNDLVEQVEDFKFLERDNNDNRQALGHPKLIGNGELIFHSVPLRKIDACSNLLFQSTHDAFHHSIEIDVDGNIWVPSHLYPQTLDTQKVGRADRYSGYLDDAIVNLSRDGQVIYEKSVSKIFIENDLEHLLFSVGDRLFDKDPIHLNDIQPAKFDGKFWKQGDVFLSLRHQSMVLLFRPSTNEIVWKGAGKFFHQHDVDILDDHRISVFNNNSKDFADGDVVDGHNEVIIYDFETDEYMSYMKQSLINNDVRTITGGRSQILPTGDLFVEETDYGRTLYFNADGSLRWTHVNRAKNGETYALGLSRILYTPQDIAIVSKFLETMGNCDA